MSLIARWPLNGNAKDEAFGNYDGIVHGSPAWTSGVLGDCYDNTAGNGTGVELMQHADAKKYDNVYSWSLWFKSTTTSGNSNRRILARGDSEYGTVTIDQNQSSPQNLGSDARGSASVNEWHHLAFLHKSDRTTITYVDGVKQGTASAPKDGTARPWVIGGNTEGDGDISGDHFVGKIDDVRFYDHILSVHEIKELSRAKVGHWTFRGGKPLDQTPQQNHGEISGDPQPVDGIIGPDALDFDGNDSVDLPNKSALKPKNAVTASMWAYLDSNGSGNRYLLLVGRDVTGGYMLDAGNDNWNARVANNNGDTSNGASESANLDTWQHVVLTYESGAGGSLYVDGSKAGTLPDIGDLAYSQMYGSSPSIGSHGGIYYYDGRLDDVRIYATALDQSAVQDLYETKGRIDDQNRLHTHSLSEGDVELFSGGSFGPAWSTPNAYIQTDTAKLGRYSMGSAGQGSVDADWTPSVLNGGRQIDSFSYWWWWETTSQSGHQVRLYDSNGNKVQQSETENPQWQFSDGSGSMVEVRGYDSNHYENWTLFRMEFDWDAGTYSYFAKNSTGATREGSLGLINATDVAKISFVGTNGNHCRFDGIKINDEDVSKEGVFGASRFSEVGPAAGNLVGWWDFDRESARDKAGTNDGSLNGSGYSFVDGPNDGLSLSLDGSDPYASVPQSSKYTSKSATIALWVRADSSHSGTTRLVYHTGSDSAIILNGGTGLSIEHRGCGGSYSGGSTLPSTGTWHHVVYVWDDNTDSYQTYVNGSAGASGSMGGGCFSNTDGGLHFGTGHWTNSSSNLNGEISDVRVYDRALTSEEVNILYDTTRGESMKMTPQGIYAPQVSETSL